MKGFLEGGHPDCVSVHAVFDNEEIGSLTKQGADSTFLEDVLRRINSAMGRSGEEYLMAIAPASWSPLTMPTQPTPTMETNQIP